MIKRLEYMACQETLREQGIFTEQGFLEKVGGDTAAAFGYLREGYWEDRANFFTKEHTGRTRAVNRNAVGYRWK